MKVLAVEKIAMNNRYVLFESWFLKRIDNVTNDDLIIAQALCNLYL